MTFVYAKYLLYVIVYPRNLQADGKSALAESKHEHNLL